MEIFLGYSNHSNFLSYSSGLYLAVHNQSYHPLIPDEGIQIPSGKSNSVAIKRTFLKKLEHPFSDCISEGSNYNSDLYRYTISISKYTQKYCLKFCYQKLVIEKCSCINSQYRIFNLNDTKPCLTPSQLECMFQVNEIFYSNDYIKNNCEPYCPIECTVIDYSLNVFGTDFPGYGYANFMTRQATSPYYRTENPSFHSDIKKEILEVNVFYDSETYVEIFDQPSLDVSSFVSNIGGQLGLFLGMSMLSMIEILDLLLRVILNFVHRRTVVKVSSYQMRCKS